MPEEQHETPPPIKKTPIAAKITPSYAKEQYGPKRKEAETDLLESGLKSHTPEFRKARSRTAKKYYSKERTGEIDGLTGTYNRTGFDRRYDEEVKNAKRTGRPVAMLALDLGELKKYNDTMGHDAGDNLLKTTAAILRNNTRAGDVVGRWGGDEFSVILRGADQTIGNEYWNRINGIFESNNIIISAGLVEVDLDDPVASRKLADTRLYLAKARTKQAGRNVLQSSEKTQTA